MAKQKRPFNVFYVLLVVVGILFVVTACAYFVMAARARNAVTVESSALMARLDKHGALALGMELAVLAVCTVAAIAWDQLFDRPDASNRGRRTGFADKTASEPRGET